MKGLPAEARNGKTGNCTVGSPTESFTIDFWIRTTSYNAPIIDKRAALGPVGYYVYLSGGRIHFQMNGSVFPTPSSGPFINNNLRHFVAITVPRCTPTAAAIYVDGVQVVTFTPPPLNLMNGSSLVIGKNAIGVSGFLRGCLDELEIFKRALTAYEVQLIFAAGQSGKCKG